ncbi:MAG: insulinase family protein [Planctomycetes bacterium]|nr:insulinase family protein [Planctomycetota bacterium]
MTIPELPFSPDDVLHGFRVVRITPIHAMNMTAAEFRHDASGARLFHLAADDPENLFSVAFRTPPPDDTGLPHILEHTVLCGSRRYPVKDPFVELLKTSLATFLNAFTYPDRTVYPCSSMNPKDFHNLMRVYADAVFFPNITEDHFRQEGHHLEFTPDGSLITKGVVYNEMRGVYSDPDGILDRHVQRLLFDSNAYGRDFGGDPKAIPELTYKQFVDFHKAYYHPSNAWMFTYGNVDIRETLAILDAEYLKEFTAIDLDSTIGPLETWQEPRSGQFTYPLDQGDSETARTDIAVAFTANDRRNVLETLAMKVADAYLLDNAASPLRKALIDSKLGEELGSSGYADYQRDTFFIVALKGSEPDRAAAVEKLILDTVADECRNGFDQDKVETALHRLELASREIRSQYPLRLLERVFGAWLYDSDPLGQVDISGNLDELRATLAANPRFLEETTKRWLLDNPHRLRVTLVPDKHYVEKNDKETADAMQAVLSGLDATEQENVRDIARRLEEMQSAGNSEAALATLPRLAIKDVSPRPLPLRYDATDIRGRDYLRVPMYAGGVGYLAMGIQVSGLSDDEILLLPLLAEALGKTGAAGHDYAEIAMREAAVTGAIDFAAGLGSHVDGPDHCIPRLTVWMKALESDWDKALAVLTDRLFRAEWGDRDRLRDIILQSRMSWRNQLVPSGNAYAALYAALTLSPAMYMSERLSGTTQARFIDRLAENIDRELDSLPDRLGSLIERVIAGGTIALSHIGCDECDVLTRGWLDTVAGRFTGNGARQQLTPPPAVPARIGLAAPADVAFDARAMPAPVQSDPDAAALAMLGVQLSYGFLWNEVRVKGGAYGVRASYDGHGGRFTFSSFRDPNVLRTLDAFAAAARYVQDGMDLSPEALEQAIIGAIKTLDTPMRPPSAVVAALSRHLGGETDEFRKTFRERLLNLTADQVRNAAARTFAGMDKAPVCVLTSREKLQEENAKGGNFEIEALFS